MRKTIIHTGFHQRSNEDLTHMQDGLIEAITSVLNGLASSGTVLPNCILHGCVITPTVLSFADISAGAVILDGEICIFDGVTNIDLDVAPNILVYSPIDTYLAGNPVTYGDLSTKNVHLIRKAEIIPVSIAAANQLALFQKTFIQLLQTNLASTEGWHKVGATGEPAMPSFGWVSGTSTLYFRKNLLDNSVEVRGTLNLKNMNTVTDPPTNYALYTLPAGYHPSFEIPFVATIRVHGVAYSVNSNNDVIKLLNMSVDTGGNVSINPEYIAAGTAFTCRFYCKFPLS